MNGPVLTKSQKRIARQIIEKGLQQDFVSGIKELDTVISNWKAKSLPNRETWYDLYEKLTKHDEHIARRYDSMGASKYLYVIASQLAEGLIDKTDLAAFNEDVKEAILYLSGIDN